jgi:hypothetical protein
MTIFGVKAGHHASKSIRIAFVLDTGHVPTSLCSKCGLYALFVGPVQRMWSGWQLLWVCHLRYLP